MSEELKVNIIEEVIQVNVEGWEYKEDTLPATTAENDVIVGSATIGTWVKKTLAQFKTILGLKSAAYTESSDYAASSHNHNTSYLGINAKAADSDKLNGNDSTAFATSGHNHDSTYLGINSKAADADKLDGIDSTGFSAANHNHTGVYQPEGSYLDVSSDEIEFSLINAYRL